MRIRIRPFDSSYKITLICGYMHAWFCDVPPRREYRGSRHTQYSAQLLSHSTVPHQHKAKYFKETDSREEEKIRLLILVRKYFRPKMTQIENRLKNSNHHSEPYLSSYLPLLFIKFFADPDPAVFLNADPEGN